VDDHDHHTRGCHMTTKFREEEVLMDLDRDNDTEGNYLCKLYINLSQLTVPKQ